MEPSLFHVFKKDKTLKNTSSQVEQAFFMIAFDEFGAYLEVVNKKLAPIELDSANFSGFMRQVIKRIEFIRETEAFSVDWEKASDRLYLNEHEYLLESLRGLDNLIAEDAKPIQFKEKIGRLNLQIQITDRHPETEEVTDYYSDLFVEVEEETWYHFQPLSERFILIKQHIVQVPPLGIHAQHLAHFNTEFPASDLERFTSLFYSYTQDIELSVEEKKISFQEHPIETQNTLLFEKIDSDESLYMRVVQAIPNFPPSFLDEYELSSIVQLNEFTGDLVVAPVAIDALGRQVAELEKDIKKLQRKNKSNYLLEDNLFILDKALAAEFIYKSLPALLEHYQIFGSENLKGYKIVAAAPTLNLSLSSGIDFLEGDATLDFGTEQISLFDVINQYNKQRYVKLADGTNAIINQKYMDRLQRIFKKKKGKDGKIEVSFFDLPLVEEFIDEKTGADFLQKSKEVFEGFNQLKSAKTKLPKVNAKLRPYQKSGFKWLNYLHKQDLGGCLADDMGLGKTLQTITLFSTIYPKETLPSLVVMPRSLLFNWENEVKKFNPNISTYTYYGNTRDWEEAEKANLIFITYGLARTQIEELREKEFYYLVLDESQNIKNVNSQTNKAIMLLNAKHRLALSGTPIENHLGELYALFRFLNPAMFGSLDNFTRHYLNPIQKDNNELAAKDLRKKIYPFILRRLKKDVLKDLPPKIEQTLYVEMSKSQAKLYEQRRSDFQARIKNEVAKNGIQSSQFFIFQALNELRQLASIPEAKTDGKITSSKKELLTEQLSDALVNGHKVLIFANFLAAIEQIGIELQNMGISYVSMTGATRNRQQLVEQFQNDPSCQVFVMTLKTGGTGLNLTAADMVFIFDPWWNVAAENQAIDRTHRIGQKNSVTTYKLITKGTIEEKILLLQEQKKELFDAIIGTDSASIKSLSEDDINFILS